MINFLFNSFSNANVLDTPVTAVIFIINKCIANFHNVLVCLSNPKLNGCQPKFCWIKEVVGLSSHLCNPKPRVMSDYAINYM